MDTPITLCFPESLLFTIMPITNQEAAPNAAMKPEIEDYTTALEVVKTYSTQDGLDVDTLLDSDKHGALTYNNFLLLPGYIGKPDTFAGLARPIR